MTKPAVAVRALGQSIWMDNIRRDWLVAGEFERMVREDGIAGVTSNPTIFEKAIAGGNDYDEQLREIAGSDLDAGGIFDALASRDLMRAADVLRAYYDSTNGDDGFVSWEVSPELANDTQGTLADARRLWATLDRPNAMIKIPATLEGLPAIEEALYEGININITLLFAVERYEAVMEAYLRGLERRVAEGTSVDRIRSVASFFVSRVDSAVDKKLDEKLKVMSDGAAERLNALRAKAAIANAKLAYERFQATFAGPRWEALKAQGAALQRPLWASTSTKDPRLPDTYYVDALIGPHTVNTLPPATVEAFNDHGTLAPTLEQGTEDAHTTLRALADAGIDMAAVTLQLEVDGVKSFADSFVALRKGIDDKRAALREGVESRETLTASERGGERGEVRPPTLPIIRGRG